MDQRDQVRWLAMENIAKHRKLLDSSTGYIRRRLLEELLAVEREGLESCSRDKSDVEPANPPQAGLPMGEDHSADLPDDRR